MSADLAIQKAIRTRLIATGGVTSLVPATSILDRNARPNPDPAIIIGEDQAVDEGDIARRQQRVYSTLHIWKKEGSLTGAKAIGGAIRAAIHAGRPDLETGWHCADWFVSGVRYLRDPDGETSHGVVTIESLVGQVPA